jgi:hypothetical protein
MQEDEWILACVRGALKRNAAALEAAAGDSGDAVAAVRLLVAEHCPRVTDLLPSHVAQCTHTLTATSDECQVSSDATTTSMATTTTATTMPTGACWPAYKDALHGREVCSRGWLARRLYAYGQAITQRGGVKRTIAAARHYTRTLLLADQE